MSLPLLVTIESSNLRLALRAYFTVMFPLFGFLGDKCLAYRAQRNVIARKQVAITSMTGWLTNISLAVAIIGFRRLPGGLWFGTLMIVSTILSLLSDLAVSGLVQTVNVATRCPFSKGLVVPQSFSPAGFWAIPPNNGAPYFVVAQAQLTSSANGGLVGIYWKVNRDLNFRADTLDVAGQWNCKDINNDIEHDADTTPNAIVADLANKGYIYRKEAPNCASNYGNGTFSHPIVLDSSVGNNTGVVFDVRASIDLTANGPDTKKMKSFHCVMDAKGVEWVLKNIVRFANSQAMVPWSAGEHL
jgi:hypothetical protein